MSRRAILGVLLCITFLAGTASAGVNLNVNIGTPPAVVIAQPPALTVVPGTYVYVAPDVNANLVFYQDNWYRQNGGGWFVSVSYNGPWQTVSAPPAALVHLPPNYRTVPAGNPRMPYAQVRDNWRGWERDRHWDAREDQGGEHDRGKHNKHKKKHHDDDDHDNGRGREKHRHDD